MAITTLEEAIAEIKRLALLTQALTNKVNEIQTAINNLASLEQLRRINLINQTNTDSINSDIEALEARVTSLENDID